MCVENRTNSTSTIRDQSLSSFSLFLFSTNKKFKQHTHIFCCGKLYTSVTSPGKKAGSYVMWTWYYCMCIIHLIIIFFGRFKPLHLLLTHFCALNFTHKNKSASSCMRHLCCEQNNSTKAPKSGQTAKKGVKAQFHINSTLAHLQSFSTCATLILD